MDKLDLDLEEEEELEPELDKTPRARPSPKGSLSKPNGLAASAAAFAADVRAGVSPEDAAAAALGAREAKALTEAQKKYADKVAAALAAKAEADARAKAERARKFELGKALYAKGMYPQSVRALVAALDAEGPFSQLGGEIQLWLALAHSATGDEAAAIAVYREVEASHPSPKMRKQAYELRYIAEAPKLRVGADEKPQLPEVEPPRIGGEKGDRRRAPRPPPAPMGVKPKRTRPLTLEVRDNRERERERKKEFFFSFGKKKKRKLTRPLSTRRPFFFFFFLKHRNRKSSCRSTGRPTCSRTSTWPWRRAWSPSPRPCTRRGCRERERQIDR